MTDKLSRVWRLENVQGAGPYRTSAWGGLIREMTARGFNPVNSEAHPAPENDPDFKTFMESVEDIRSWLFGFRDIEAYKAWFNTSEVREFLQENGFFLTCYETEKGRIHHGSRQSLLRRPGATIRQFADATGNVVETDAMTPEMQNLVASRKLPYDPEVPILANAA